jgi:ubiquinone/menaquinone biosynthesis C-methylase UbiE
MARTPSNRSRIEWTVSLLNIKPADRVLEIGIGPGVATELVSQLATNGHVVGVDHSEVMIRQAARRNAAAVRNGRLEFVVASVSALPDLGEPFDKVFTINSIHFWNDPVRCLTALHKVLKPGGIIAVALQPRSHGATDATAQEAGREVAGNLARAGFSSIRLEIRRMRPVAVTCALGVK